MIQFATYEEENIHYWTNRASGYSGVNQEELASDQKTVWRGVISRRIAARFPDRSPAQIRVLDVGTGPGFFAIILAELGYQVTAVDYTASMLEEAKGNAGVLAEKIDFRQMNAEKLTFSTASFDVLRGLGMQAAADTEVWKQVWTKEERINNASTPMFLVEGMKVGVAI